MTLPDLAITLRPWRKAQGLTQAEAAELFGVNTLSVVRWEHGTFTPPYATHALITLAMIQPRVYRALVQWAEEKNITM